MCLPPSPSWWPHWAVRARSFTAGKPLPATRERAAGQVPALRNGGETLLTGPQPARAQRTAICRFISRRHPSTADTHPHQGKRPRQKRTSKNTHPSDTPLGSWHPAAASGNRRQPAAPSGTQRQMVSEGGLELTRDPSVWTHPARSCGLLSPVERVPMSGPAAMRPRAGGGTWTLPRPRSVRTDPARSRRVLSTSRPVAVSSSPILTSPVTSPPSTNGLPSVSAGHSRPLRTSIGQRSAKELDLRFAYG